MRFFIKDIQGISRINFFKGSTYSLEAASENTVFDLMNIITENGVSVCNQKITFGGNYLQDATLLSELENDSTLELTSSLLGGKVHGSLSRAGKVRESTPKVAKSEKKRVAVGRAKKRLAYRKRFQVLAEGAKRPSPNKNAGQK